MKTLLFVIPFLLIGCCPDNIKKCDSDCITYVPVYEKPKFDMPSRPVLSEVPVDASDGVVVRTVETNFLDLRVYTEQLENILNQLKK